MSHGHDHDAGNDLTGVEVLRRQANALRILGASVLDAEDIGTHAIEYGVNHWPVIPLNGKLPAIPNPHPKGGSRRQECHGECGFHGHGVRDATTDVTTLALWWGGKYSGCNIGGRVPDSMFVIDVDPRNGGLDSLADLEAKKGSLPETLTTISGRGDGGCHRFYRRPPGRLSSKLLGSGIDLKTSTGYVVLAPSIHPETGCPYVRIDAPVVAPPNWLIELMTLNESKKPVKVTRSLRDFRRGFSSIADRFSASTSWLDILDPHGWHCLCGDPDAEGARWLHPTHTSSCSATIRKGCLFVYSSNTVFDVTEPGYPRGYTRFRAFAQLNYGGDLSAAAHALIGRVV